MIIKFTFADGERQTLAMPDEWPVWEFKAYYWDRKVLAMQPGPKGFIFAGVVETRRVHFIDFSSRYGYAHV